MTSVSTKLSIVDAVGRLSSFNLFSLPSKLATSNFYSFVDVDTDGKVLSPDLPSGPLLQNHMFRLPSKAKFEDLLPVDLKKKDAACVYLPLALPLRKNDFVPKGGIECGEALDALIKLHPLACAWATAITECIFL